MGPKSRLTERVKMLKMITSDLKGNHTYCKPECRGKCHSFKLFHLHHIHCRVWARVGPFPAPVLYCSLSSAGITSDCFLYPTMKLGVSSHRLWLWQQCNIQTEIHFWIVAPFHVPLWFFVGIVTLGHSQLFLLSDAECESQGLPLLYFWEAAATVLLLKPVCCHCW